MGKIKKKDYLVSIKWYPKIYSEMYKFYKFNILPEDRINESINPSLYIMPSN